MDDKVFVTFRNYDNNGRITVYERYITRHEFLEFLFNTNERTQLIEELQMTEKEQLFAGFFSQAYNKGLNVAEMTMTQLDDWVTTLEKIVFEAKATLHGASQAKRERSAKLSPDEREKIRLADVNYSASDAITSVNKRKDRLSKKEKLEETYRGLGMSEADIQGMLSKISIDEDTQEKRKNIILSLSEKKENSEKKEKPNLIDSIVQSIVEAEKKKANVEPTDFNDLDNLFK